MLYGLQCWNEYAFLDPQVSEIVETYYSSPQSQWDIEKLATNASSSYMKQPEFKRACTAIVNLEKVDAQKAEEGETAALDRDGLALNADKSHYTIPKEGNYLLVVYVSSENNKEFKASLDIDLRGESIQRSFEYN